jgi:glyoxylase-like metal-dependent hydrolase (beta-lactamase superfamily II)
MEVREVASGLWVWSAYHEAWKENVGSVYCETGDGVVLVDPLAPADHADAPRFWRALDRDVARAGGGVHVLLTVFWHVRSTPEVAERYQARTWAPATARAPVTRRGVAVTDPFRPGDPLPGGIEAFGTARTSEVVYWIPHHRALVPGDVLLGADAGGVRMCPRSWLPETKSLDDLGRSLRPLLDLPVERILVSHGEPVLRRGRKALAAALGSPYPGAPYPGAP